MALQSLQIVGNGHAFGSGKRPQSCYLLKSDGCTALVDLGSTAMLSLLQLEIDLNSIDVIILSHYHGDHFGGVPFFLLNSFFKEDRSRELVIAGPGETMERIQDSVNCLYRGLYKKLPAEFIRYVDYRSGQTRDILDLRMDAFEMLHSPNSNPHGLRIQGGDKVFSYSGDTAWNENIPILSNNADIFLVECTYFSDARDGHLDKDDLLGHLDLLNAKRVLVTHMEDEMLQAIGTIPELEEAILYQKYSF